MSRIGRRVRICRELHLAYPQDAPPQDAHKGRHYMLCFPAASPPVSRRTLRNPRRCMGLGGALQLQTKRRFSVSGRGDPCGSRVWGTMKGPGGVRRCRKTCSDAPCGCRGGWVSWRWERLGLRSPWWGAVGLADGVCGAAGNVATPLVGVVVGRGTCGSYGMYEGLEQRKVLASVTLLRNNQ